MTISAKFNNLTLRKQISFDELIGEVVTYTSDPAAEYEITVGTDSPGVSEPFFVTAVSVLRIGNGGRYFWTKTERIKCHTFQERIYKEAMQSITLIQELKSRLKEELGEEFFWDNKIKVHLDVGRKGPTKEFVDGIVGMVKGYGFEAVIKPDSFCACSVADKHT